MTTTTVVEGGINYHHDGRREEGMAGGELTLAQDVGDQRVVPGERLLMTAARFSTPSQRPLSRSTRRTGLPPFPKPVRKSGSGSAGHGLAARRLPTPAGDICQERRDQTLNELPQPQAEVAFGFFTWNAEPTISST